jgi:predicted transcriptional regulator of viral defense system
LTFSVAIGDNIPYSDTEYQVETADFLAVNSVFSLDQANRELAPRGGRVSTVERLKHYLEKGRLKRVARGVYAVVPSGTQAERFQPDPFLAAQVLREDCIFSYHSALELLGAAHSEWKAITVYTGHRRRSLRLNNKKIQFLDHPKSFRNASHRRLGVRRVEYQAKLLSVTGQERTLVEGFRRPALAGGLEELVASAGGFPVLELDLLEKILRRYGIATLWAAVGWFLERFQRSFQVPEQFLTKIEKHRPRAPHYLVRGQRGGTLAVRWNVILPPGFEKKNACAGYFTHPPNI